MGEIQDKKRIAELCGAIIGDGWIEGREKGFFIAGDPIDDKEYYDNNMRELIKDVLNIDVITKEFPYWGVYGISIYKGKIIKKLLKLGLPKGKKANSAFIPSWILKSKEEIALSFIRGLFDSDGCIFFQKDYTRYAKDFNAKYHSKARLRISSISEMLINQLFDLSKKHGFKCLKRRIKRGFKNNRNNKDVFIFEINELNSLKKWFGVIRPSNPKHTTKYLIWRKFGFCPPRTNINQRKDILKNKLNPYSLYKQG